MIESVLDSSAPSEHALPGVDPIENTSRGPVWLRLVHRYAIAGQIDRLKQAIDTRRARAADGTDAYIDIAQAVLTALECSDPLVLRAANERSHHRLPHYTETEVPTLLRGIEQRIVSTRSLAGSLPPYNYGTTTHAIWRRGLDLMADGRYRAALKQLLVSMERYRLGGMRVDTIWSCYDAIVCHLFLRQERTAKALFDALSPDAEGNDFCGMSRAMLLAYREGRAAPVEEARRLFARRWPGYADSRYPEIFAAFAAHVTTASPRGGGDGQDTAAVEAETDTRTSTLPFLLARVARPTPDEIVALTEIARSVEVGATRGEPDAIQFQMEVCRSTLAGRVPWDQGLLYLTTEAHDGPGTEIVGSCKLQFPVDACWVMRERTRVAQRSARASYDVLEFEAVKSHALEMAGNVVIARARGRGVGKFQTQARLLFVLMHPPAGIRYLFANLLTVDVGGRYPFYETVVRPLLGDLDYDVADRLRYTNVGYITELLGETRYEPACQFPAHSLPADLRAALGTVRPVTERARAVLVRYGFRRTNKFDLLDLGPYYRLDLERLQQARLVDVRTVRPVDELPDMRRAEVTFAPIRPAAEFACLRATAVRDATRDDLCLQRSLCQAAGIAAGTKVLTITDAAGDSGSMTASARSGAHA